MDDIKQFACEGVSKIQLTDGKIIITFSNQAKDHIPVVEGECAQIVLPIGGFLHLRACIQEMITKIDQILKINSKQPAVSSKKDSEDLFQYMGIDEQQNKANNKSNSKKTAKSSKTSSSSQKKKKVETQASDANLKKRKTTKK